MYGVSVYEGGYYGDSYVSGKSGESGVGAVGDDVVVGAD